MATNELSASHLSKEETDEYLEINYAINNGQRVYNCTTDKGDYLMYCKN